MSLKSKLDQRVAPWALLQHPFYQAWEAGELPTEALQAYAREYGAFIANLPQGWETLNDTETAAEEREHAEMWADFAAALESRVGEAELPAVADLVAHSQAWFASPEEALGALYAFEVQQPATAKSKLDGLRAYYAIPAKGQAYFEAHQHNEHEAEKLLARIEGLDAEAQDRALQACEQMSQALWDALTDIHQTYCAM